MPGTHGGHRAAGSGQVAHGQDQVQPGPGVAGRSVQRLPEIAPHRPGAGQAEAAPPGRERVHHAQAPAAFGELTAVHQPRHARPAAIADDQPRALLPQAVAHQHPAASRAVHHRVAEQLAHHHGGIGSIDRAVVPADGGADPVPDLAAEPRVGVEDLPAGSAPSADDHRCLPAA